MRSWKRGTARVAMVVGLVTAGAVTVPGTAHAGTVWEIWNNYNGLFLDSDPNGNVYAIPRQNNRNQKWVERANGLRSNAATGLCLAHMLGSKDVFSIRTVKCDGSMYYQQWKHEKHRGGVLIRSVPVPGNCLASGDEKDSAGARTTYSRPCDASDKKQLWSVRAV
ncbi:RICIN domain-containing protein [Nonomuraea lactucae]|uniref:RICIN domain-containing protein n=1 Tax=Nonomuraea lactucae TaxID=2249762 RepID=UPI000DE3B395|nr:ricin-type beta-trefoil lectin domain protein [Nonomuraea lactucae]